VNPGATALYREIELVAVLPSMLGTPEALFLDLLLSQVPEINQLKQEGENGGCDRTPTCGGEPGRHGPGKRGDGEAQVDRCRDGPDH
jgi:hypothetical protein